MAAKASKFHISQIYGVLRINERLSNCGASTCSEAGLLICNGLGSIRLYRLAGAYYVG